MNGKVTILGSGTSFGVPVIGCDCAVCQSTDPRDRRTRVAAVIESAHGTRVLIDTPPEMRLQLVRENIESVDAVFFTHEHADHVHGIDDLRAVSVRNGTLPLYAPPRTAENIRERFAYIFDPNVKPPKGSHKPDLHLQAIGPDTTVEIGDLQIQPIPCDHGIVPVYGYRVGNMAYLTDVKRLSDEAFARLQSLDTLVINALFEKPHPTHLSIPEALDVVERLRVPRTYLTHLTHRYSHVDLSARLPEGIEPAYDGLVFEF